MVTAEALQESIIVYRQISRCIDKYLQPLEDLLVPEKDKGKQFLWYVRRQDQVKGPFPSGSIRRFLLLGRVLLDDEVSIDKTSWCPVSKVPEVIPPEVRKALKQGTTTNILPAKLREDERNGRDRRAEADTEEEKERRASDRRQNEPKVIRNHRAAKTDLRELSKQRRFPLSAVSVMSILLALAIGYGVYLGAPPALPDPDCGINPGPGVNWRNCRLDALSAESRDFQGGNLSNTILRNARLSGSLFNDADLQYADLSGADLSHGEFKRAGMKGTELRNADLSYADLGGADLSFSNLSGANLGGANLNGADFSQAIWIDGKKCLAGSVGECVVAAE